MIQGRAERLRAIYSNLESVSGKDILDICNLRLLREAIDTGKSFAELLGCPEEKDIDLDELEKRLLRGNNNVQA